MKPQFIKIENGELVVLARSDYHALVKRAKGVTDEDEGTVRIIARSDAALDAGQEMELPADIAEAIARGENPLRVVREWQGKNADVSGLQDEHRPKHNLSTGKWHAARNSHRVEAACRSPARADGFAD